MKTILTADLHIRKTRPRCRLDPDWLGTQRKTLQYIVDVTNEKKTNLIIVGDIFHTSRQSAEMINMAIDILKGVEKKVYILPGQHDLPYHEYGNEHRSAYGVLKRTFNEIDIVKGLFNHIFTENKMEIFFLHTLTFPSKKEQPMPDIGITAEDLLKKYPKAKWIFTGDYHKAFHYEKNDHHVVNPGCVLRQASDFIDYKPTVYYVDTDKGIVEPIPLPDTSKIIVTDAYIKLEKEREDRIESFISMVEKQGKVTLNFMNNLKERMETKKINSGTKDVLMEIIEEIN